MVDFQITKTKTCLIWFSLTGKILNQIWLVLVLNQIRDRDKTGVKFYMRPRKDLETHAIYSRYQDKTKDQESHHSVCKTS